MDEEDYYKEGFYKMKGALVCLGKSFSLGLVIFALMMLIRCAFNIGIDDSDKDGWHRSGFRILKDHKTGIEYISDGHGGLIRRGQ